MGSGRVVSLGSVNADIVYRPAGHQPPGLRRGTALLRTSGGKAGNAAVFAGRIGVPVELWGCVGRDDLAELALRGPGAAGVVLDQVRRSDQHTGLALVEVAADGDKTITQIPGANEDWQDVAGVFEQMRARGGADVLVVDLELPIDVATAAVRAARQRGIAVVLDPSPADLLTDQLLRGTHVTPDHREAEFLTHESIDGPAAAARAAAALCRRGALAAYVKLAHGGCVLAAGGECCLVEAPEVAAVDSTGAGDAFAAGVACAVWHGADPVDAARQGVAAAWVAVQAYGAQASYPDRAGLDAALAGVTVRVVS